MPSESPEPKTRYIVKSVVHASAILGSFRSPGEVLRLRDIVSRSGLSKGMCFRLLYTMHDCGLLEKVGENEYRISFPLSGQHRFRIGYAGQDRSSSFCRQLLDGLVRACQKAQFELIVAANHHNLKAARTECRRVNPGPRGLGSDVRGFGARGRREIPECGDTPSRHRYSLPRRHLFWG